MSEETFFKLLYAAVQCILLCGCWVAICILWVRVAESRTPEEELGEELSAALKRWRPLTAEEYLRRK